jgi:hypothetical protein
LYSLAPNVEQYEALRPSNTYDPRANNKIAGIKREKTNYHPRNTKPIIDVTQAISSAPDELNSASAPFSLINETNTSAGTIIQIIKKGFILSYARI